MGDPAKGTVRQRGRKPLRGRCREDLLGPQGFHACTSSLAHCNTHSTWASGRPQLVVPGLPRVLLVLFPSQAEVRWSLATQGPPGCFSASPRVPSVGAIGWDVACRGIAQTGQAAKRNPSGDKQPDEMTALSKNVLSGAEGGGNGGFVFTGSFPRNSSGRRRGGAPFVSQNHFVCASLKPKAPLSPPLLRAEPQSLCTPWRSVKSRAPCLQGGHPDLSPPPPSPFPEQPGEAQGHFRGGVKSRSLQSG